MPIAHPPSVFVSSTCYDLAQVRRDLHAFFESMGMVPVLSEFPSFPVDPNRDAIENCLTGVKEKADIFVLVVGGRYGSETDNGKSVTNLEYLEAKAKGIPRYVFVQKPIQATFLDWQKNRSGDFSEIVDSPKLFEFVEKLSDPKENWVYPFDSAQDIIGTLHKQLAYLFMDALTIRAKVLRCGLPESLQQDLSSVALLLVVQKPYAWEYRLFGQVLSDEISRAASVKKDLDYGLALGKSMEFVDRAKIFEWVKRKSIEMKSILRSGEILLNTALPKAVGAPGKPGDVKEIVYVAKRLAEFYRCILEWTVDFRHIHVDDKFSRILELHARMSHNAIKEIEEFAVNYNQQLDDVVRRYQETKQPQSMEITLKLTCPDMTELNAEYSRLRKELGLPPSSKGSSR